MCTAQHSTAQHSTAQHSTAQHSTAQHSTAQLNSAGSSALKEKLTNKTPENAEGYSDILNPPSRLLVFFCNSETERVVTGIAFMLFFAIAACRLTNASLWFDETIEYWYSKYLVGALPWESGSSMYKRIVSTYQPPLFNVLMYLWLKIYDSEWWMRMFGVVMGMIGAAGVYKTMQHGTKSRLVASASVLSYACIYRLTYYWQEVAEYSLMLGLLSWTVYYFLLLLDRPDTKRIMLFALFCILPVYSQYGAVFPVAAFAALAFIKICADKNKSALKALLSCYGAAAVCAALPLYWFFLRVQMHRQTNQGALSKVFWLKSFSEGWRTAFKWNFIANMGTTGAYVASVVAVLLVVFMLYYLIRGKTAWLRYLLAANVVCYVLYFPAVYIGAYSYGRFGSRYCLFFIPVWFVSFLLLIYTLLNELAESGSPLSVKVSSVGSGVVIALLLCWGFLGYSAISKNWDKEDIRGVTEAWFKHNGHKTDTLVYYAADGGFSYYLTHDKRYKPEMLKRIIFMKWYRDKTAKQYAERLNKLYNEWPKKLYLVASHSRADLKELLKSFTDVGYISKDIYNKSGGRLVYLEFKGDGK